MDTLKDEDIKLLLSKQKDELTESMVYKALASIEKNTENKNVLTTLSEQEKTHASVLRQYTGKDVTPNKWKIRRISYMARVLGTTFTIKKMEDGEKKATCFYSRFESNKELMKIKEEETEHEKRLINMIDEERLGYMSSVVLGLNDALVEFTGALAGFTLALNSSSLIALTGSITGIAAALSMASSEYLSTKSERNSKKHPLKASVYTGIAYMFTVFFLVLPFVLFNNVLTALGIMLLFALIIIALFNYYYSIAKGENFRHRFAEMAILSFSVSTISFLIGYALKYFTGIEA
jgi:Uncharacterized membrane protein